MERPQLGATGLEFTPSGDAGRHPTTRAAGVSAAIDQLQRDFLDADQIRSSRAIMGLDRQLIDDGTYFVIEHEGTIVGCGGWSRRATLYGGDHAAGRDSALLDPAADAAKVRAMYTHPTYTRRGIGRRILTLCEAAAGAEEFAAIGHGEDASGGVPVPIVHMRKAIDRTV